MFDKLAMESPKKKTSVKFEPAVGLDIGNYSVKVCQLGRQDNRFKLTGLGSGQVDVLNPKAVVEAIKSACSQAHISTKKVNASVFPEGVIIRYLLLPLMSEDELKKANIRATFFMLGEHAARYPEIVRRVAGEGHEIGNHTYDHHVLFNYTREELVKEIKDTEQIIQKTTGKTTVYFRPPKAWLTLQEKKEIEKLGYKIILWSLNSKDWVTFDDKYIVKYIVKNIKPGDIILFHDSGGVFGTEGGDRHETVKAIPLLVEALAKNGYRFVTLTELMDKKTDDGNI